MRLLNVLCDIYLIMTVNGGFFQCSENELLEDCKKSCQPSCQRPHISICDSQTCRPGCICKPGTIRDEETGRCVNIRHCPRVCSWNEEKNNGRNGCEKTCQNQHLGFQCVIQNKRCVCKPGLLRDLHSGECVHRDHCPKVQCEFNEEWNECTNPISRASCQNRFRKLKPHSAICIPGCECKHGFIWDEYTKKCIVEYQCPNVCGENQEWKKCSDIGWKQTCQNPESKVDKQVCMAGCSCKHGYLWDEHYEKCVLKEQCSKVCRENEEWCKSISNHMVTCQNILRSQCHKYLDTSFTTMKSGCICKEGLIWNEIEEKCVLLKDCPKVFSITTTTTNVLNTEFKEFPTSMITITTNLNTGGQTELNTYMSTSPQSVTETLKNTGTVKGSLGTIRIAPSSTDYTTIGSNNMATTPTGASFSLKVPVNDHDNYIVNQI